jgi:Zn-finger nucleic acid-binding protein
VDQCIIHGIWLDSGELTHLLEWKKAGGQLLHQQHAEALEKQQQQKQNVLPNAKTDYSAKTSGGFSSALDIDIVAAVADLLDKLF